MIKKLTLLILLTLSLQAQECFLYYDQEWVTFTYIDRAGDEAVTQAGDKLIIFPMVVDYSTHTELKHICYKVQ